MINRSDKACLRILLHAGLLPKEQLDSLQREAQTVNLSLHEMITRSGVLPESRLLELYAKDANSRSINLKAITVDRKLLEKVPVKFVWYYKLFPVALENGRLTIAISHPLDVHTLDEIRFGLGYEIETAFAPYQDVEQMLKEHYGLGAETVDKILAKSPASGGYRAVSPTATGEKEENIEKLAEEASVVQLVNQIILEAYKKRASDIHIEPYRGKVRVRYRIDGRLQETRIPPEMNQFLLPILSRIKIMANLNIVERRLPQDGKARVKTQDQVLNLRISSLPTPHGESLVIRILPTKMLLGLAELGFEPENLKIFRKLIQEPHGIIFVTGPTGSGKSTTLYAALKELNTTDRKIITLEDPIEYEMADMIQMHVIPEIGLTFARGLRSVLRHDPDVMMVGEVRDFETADIAIRVALTGHLILSTLHTNDAASGVTRLLDIGVEPYLIASSVLAFMAQRLVRMICPNCRAEDTAVLEEVKRIIRADLGLPPEQPVTLYYGKGCDACSQTGHSGRLALHEVLVLNETMHKLILTSAPAEEIKMKAVESGMQTLRQDGWRKVLKGLTTPEEVMQATPADRRSGLMLAPPAASEKRSDQENFRAEAGEGRAFQEVPRHFKGHEKRKYTRVGVPLDVLFRPINVETYQAANDGQLDIWKGEGESINISAGGLAFHSPEKLLAGDVIEIKFGLRDGKESLECIGRVLRVTKRESDGKEDYEAGVSFLAIHSIDRLRIENFCKEKMKHEKV